MPVLTHQSLIRPVWILALMLAPLLAWGQTSWKWAEDQPLGATLPDFKVTNHKGKAVRSSSFAGKRGTLIIFSRSTDW